MIEEYREAGKIRFVGLTGHTHPAQFPVHIAAHEFDTVLTSLAADYASDSGIIHVADLKAPKPEKREETRFVRNDPPLRRN